MKGFELADSEMDRTTVENETRRIFSVCDGCRRCINLCPSFNTLLTSLDVVESDVNKLMPHHTEQIVEECYYCKLCFNNCPYTPPHRFEVDFPRLMVTWKHVHACNRLPPLRDRILIRTDLIGKIGTLFAPLATWVSHNRFVRGLLHIAVGIHRDRQLVRFHSQTFPALWKRTYGSGRPALNSAQERVGKVALFSACLVNYHCPEIGDATVAVLNKNGIEVILPEQQCCGMPYLDIGDLAGIKQKAAFNLRTLEGLIRQGYEVVTRVPSCSLMLKREYPDLLKSDQARSVSKHTFDVCEYLINLKRQGKLNATFQRRPVRIAYQVPCHLRDQNIGLKSKELMELTGATVEVVERCTGHDGTWAVKKEFYDLSMKIAEKTVRQLKDCGADLVVSDCPLAALQLDQAGGHASLTLHPIQIVKQAYGM
jgi:glycerol-3-phosphate dehydrogenase subunit C